MYYDEGYKCKCDIILKPKKTFEFSLISGSKSKSLKSNKVVQNVKQNIMDIIFDYPLDIDPIINIKVI